MNNVCLTLKKSDFGNFVSKVSLSHQVVAPVKRGMKNYAFEKVADAAAIQMKHVPTILPPKKYFMPQREILQKFDIASHQWTTYVEAPGPTVILGVHTCDISGIQFLNQVMAQAPEDVNYSAHREKIVIIGIECNEYCDEYASCRLMRNHLPTSGYDLFMTDLGDCFIVQVASEEGEALVKGDGFFAPAGTVEQKKLSEVRKKKETIFKDEAHAKHEQLKGLFDRAHDHKVWEDLDRRCVACGNCTNVCPTCYCFDIRDELNLDLKAGFRYRMWDGCQNEEFAKVAGGENFRHKRGHRQRHRYLRKFSFPVEKFSRYTCTGCGRCSRTCMAKINLKETINAVAGGEK